MPPRKGGSQWSATTLEELTPLLATEIPSLFNISQSSLATHRKNINALHSLFLLAASITSTTPAVAASLGKKKQQAMIVLTGERGFLRVLKDCLVRVLGVKKGVEVGDRSVKFVAGFVGFAVDYDANLAAERAEMDQAEEEDDPPSARLVAAVLAFCQKALLAKSKIPRFRAVQLVALLISNLGEVDDETYQSLKLSLLRRVQDKEPTVRMQAVVGLSKLQAADSDGEGEDDEEDSEDDDDTPAERADKEEGKKKVRDVLMEILRFDSAAEVRRASLFNLLPTPQTLPILLSRTLDIDPINRRATYIHVLAEVPIKGLSLEQRENVVRRGLGERVDGVRKAAVGLVLRWAEECGGVEELVKLFDIYDGKAAELILQAVYESKPELIEDVDFGEEFYTKLTPTSILLARTYFHHLRTTSNPLLSDLEPVLTSLAFHIQREVDGLFQLLRAEADLATDGVEEGEEEGGRERERREKTMKEKVFIVRGLVEIALESDFGDEIGRRKVFELMRDLLSHPLLPPSLIPHTLDVLRKGTEERDFLRIVVEIIQGLRNDSLLVSDDEEEDEEDEAGTQETQEGTQGRKGRKMKGGGEGREGESEERRVERRKELDLRCLGIVQALLERVMGALQENSTLHGIVHELIVPSVRSKDFEIRSVGLACLGLCCLLDKNMAKSSWIVFAKESQLGEGELRVKVLQSIFDLLILYGTDFVEEQGFGAEMLMAFLLDTLEQEDPDAGATAVVGISKLMLSGLITDEEILNRLVLLYFASETADNQPLRQCLSYFFPVYCYSSPINQRRMSKIFLTSLGLLKGVYDELKDKGTMVAPLQIALQLIEWTDPQKSVSNERVRPDEAIHFDLVVEMVKDLYRQEQKDDRKLLCQLLGKLYIPEETSDLALHSLLLLIDSLKENRPLVDALSKNSLVRFENSLKKAFGERLDALDEDELGQSKEARRMERWIKGCLAGESESEDEEEAVAVAEQVEEEEEGDETVVEERESTPAPPDLDEEEEKETQQ